MVYLFHSWMKDDCSGFNWGYIDAKEDQEAEEKFRKKYFQAKYYNIFKLVREGIKDCPSPEYLGH